MELVSSQCVCLYCQTFLSHLKKQKQKPAFICAEWLMSQNLFNFVSTALLLGSFEFICIIIIIIIYLKTL